MPFFRWLRQGSHAKAEAALKADTLFDAVMDVLSEKGYFEKLLNRKSGGAQTDYRD